MESFYIGKENISVSPITFGAGTFEKVSDKALYFDLLDRYRALGGRSIDTARAYCCWLPEGDGVSETVLGEYISSRKIRNHITLITKGGFFREGERKRITKKDICEDMEKSLLSLGVDCVDVYFLHRDDENVPVEEIMPLLHSFVKEGKIRMLGASNWKGRRIEEANDFCKKEGFSQFQCSEIFFSLAKSTPEKFNDNTIVCMDDKEAEFYKKSGIPVFAFGSQAKGFFHKLYRNEPLPNKLKSRFYDSENLKAYERARVLAEKYGVSPGDIALSYLLCNPIKTSAIIGPRSLFQLEDSMKASNLSLNTDDISYLEGAIK